MREPAPGQRAQQGPLGLIALTGLCREHGQHTDRAVGAGKGQGHPAGRADAQAVSRDAGERTTSYGERHVLLIEEICPHRRTFRSEPTVRCEA